MKRFLLSLFLTLGLLVPVLAQETKVVSVDFKPSAPAATPALPTSTNTAPTSPTTYHLTGANHDIILYYTFWNKSTTNSNIGFKKKEADAYISFAGIDGYAVSSITLTNGTYASTSVKVIVGDNEIGTVTFKTVNTEKQTVIVPEAQWVAGEAVKIQTNRPGNQITVSQFEITYTKVSTDPDAVATPSIAFDEATAMVTMTCATEDASIYYTLDGTTPTADATLYTAPFELENSCTVKAIAVKDGKESAVATCEAVIPLKNANLSFPEVEYAINVGETFIAPKLSKDTDASVSYESSNTDVATVDATTGAVTIIGRGKTIITATTEATEEYSAGSASYNLIVVDPNVSMVDLHFTTIGDADWTQSYNAHAYETDAYTVEFSSFSKQNAGSAIDDIPVTKNGNIVFALKNGECFASVTFNLKQWTTKTNTAKLQYSTDGVNFKDFSPAISTSAFVVSANNIPADVIAVKLSFSNSSNQIGVESIEYTVVPKVDPLEVTIALNGKPVDVAIDYDEDMEMKMGYMSAFVGQTLSVTTNREDVIVMIMDSPMMMAEGAEALPGTMTFDKEGTAFYMVALLAPDEDEEEGYTQVDAFALVVDVTMPKNPEVDADFDHILYRDADDKVYNAFNINFMLDDNGVGADHYTLSLNGNMIDNNIAPEDFVEIEYVPYQPSYDLVFDAIDAEGYKISTYTHTVSHALDIENSVPVALEQGFYYDSATATNGTIDINLRISFDIDDYDKGYEYYFDVEGENSNILWDGEGMKDMTILSFTTAEYFNGNITLTNTEHPAVEAKVFTVFPMAHKEIEVIDEEATPARRKVNSKQDVVTTTVNSASLAEPIEVVADSGKITGIENVVVADNAEAMYYDLTGRRVVAPANGMYIRVVNGKATKVAIR